MEKNRAIFWLEATGRVKALPLPVRPLAARWVTLKDYPYRAQTYDSKTGKPSSQTFYHQEGTVWQAEQLTRDGRTETYYGFVGRHTLAKVSAAEIEFPAENEWEWASLSHGIDCRVSLVSLARAQTPVSFPEAQAGRPILVAVSLRNRDSLDLAIPESYYRTSPAPALVLGVALHLARVADEALAQQLLQGRLPRSGLDALGWSDLKPKSERRFAASAAKRKLGPTEEFQAFRCDLNDWFKFPGPGLYRLELSFSEKDGGFLDGQSRELMFIVR